jgi:hypothetical protein
VEDLDRAGERRRALGEAAAWSTRAPRDRVAEAARAIRARLARGPIVALEIEGRRALVALGDDVTVGRGDATIAVRSPLVSRLHLRLRRTDAGPFVEDLRGRNGTTLAGARVTGAVPVGDGIELTLGGQIRCVLRRADASDAASAVLVAIAGAEYLCPLGELRAGPYRVTRVVDAEDAFVVLRAGAGAPRACIDGLEATASIELAVGDVVCAGRGGPAALRVLCDGAGDEHGSAA